MPSSNGALKDVYLYDMRDCLVINNHREVGNMSTLERTICDLSVAITVRVLIGHNISTRIANPFLSI